MSQPPDNSTDKDKFDNPTAPAIKTDGGAAMTGPVTNSGSFNNFGRAEKVEVNITNTYHVAPPANDSAQIANLPHRRNPNFTGRVAELAALEQILQGGQTAALTQEQTGAVSGLGGIGKTQLAVEYVYRHHQRYKLIWWLEAEQTTSLDTGFMSLAQHLKLAGPEVKPAEALILVRNALLSRTDWLLIYDNAETPQQLDPYLMTGGHVLITSRYNDWSEFGQDVAVKAMTDEDAVALLIKRSGDTDREAALALAHELGGLPLALEQAAGYVRSTPNCQNLSEYLELFNEERQELLDSNAPLSHKDTVARTFQLAMQQINKIQPLAIELLQVLAYLAPEPFELDLLSKHANQLPKQLKEVCSNQIKFGKQIGVLGSYSLVEVAEGTITVHRLMQAAVQDTLAQAKPLTITMWRKIIRKNKTSIRPQAQWVSAALRLVAAAFPYDANRAYEGWPECAKLLPHAHTVCNYAEQLTDRTGPLSRLLNQTALYLESLGNYAEAKALYERAIAIDEATLDKKHRDVTPSYNLGRVLHHMGDLSGAKILLEQALAIDEKIHGKEHPDVARDYNRLGNVLHDMGDLPGAKALFEQALAIDEKIYGREHPTVATGYNNLAGVLQDMGNLSQARALYQRAIAICEKAYGKEHPTVAAGYNNLGNMLVVMGDLSGSKAFYQHAIAIGEATLGKEHPDVALRYNNLAKVLKDMGNLSEAKTLLERALAIQLRVWGEQHPYTKGTKRNLEIVEEEIEQEGGTRD